MKYVVIGYLVFVGFMSLVTFAVYGFDKRRARRDGRRISEQTLHRLAFFGGWPGALAGQRVFRHKTQKLGFQITFWLLTVIHLFLLVTALYLFG